MLITLPEVIDDLLKQVTLALPSIDLLTVTDWSMCIVLDRSGAKGKMLAGMDDIILAGGLGLFVALRQAIGCASRGYSATDRSSLYGPKS